MEFFGLHIHFISIPFYSIYFDLCDNLYAGGQLFQPSYTTYSHITKPISMKSIISISKLLFATKIYLIALKSK